MKYKFTIVRQFVSLFEDTADFLSKIT